MRKPIHLYVMIPLSVIACLLGLWSAFFAGLTTDIGGSLTDEMKLVIEESYAVQTSLPTRLLVILGLGLIGATIYFLVKKDTKLANYSYIAYLLYTLLKMFYNYVTSTRLAGLYTNEEFRQATLSAANMLLIVNLVLFAIYMGLTLFFTFRKPKDKPSVSSGGMDI